MFEFAYILYLFVAHHSTVCRYVWTYGFMHTHPHTLRHILTYTLLNICQLLQARSTPVMSWLQLWASLWLVCRQNRCVVHASVSVSVSVSVSLSLSLVCLCHCLCHCLLSVCLSLSLFLSFSLSLSLFYILSFVRHVSEYFTITIILYFFCLAFYTLSSEWVSECVCV